MRAVFSIRYFLAMNSFVLLTNYYNPDILLKDMILFSVYELYQNWRTRNLNRDGKTTHSQFRDHFEIFETCIYYP